MKSTVQQLLDESSVPRDALPYSDEFPKLKKRFEGKHHLEIGDAEFWQMLSSIGKGGGLGKKGNRKTAPRTPTLGEEDQLEILRLFPDGIGNRDHLPYTAKFDELHRQFHKLSRTRLTKHEFWRGLSRVAKLSRKPAPLFETAPIGNLSPELVQFLERSNPWWKAEPARDVKRYKRWAFHEVLSRFESNLAPVVVIRGPRRVGKTTIQEQVIEHLLLIDHVGANRILRVQFDDIPGLGALSNPVEAIVRWFEQNVLMQTINASARAQQPVYLLFDELQNLPKWSEQLKHLVDHVDAKTFVTGSSALRIAHGRDNLAGRMTMVELGPLRLCEIAGIHQLRDLTAFSSLGSIEPWKDMAFWEELIAHGRKLFKQRDEAFRLFSDRGGYPMCHTAITNDLALLRQQIVTEVVTKTIDFDPMRRPHTPGISTQLIKEVFRLLCRYAGQGVKPATIARELSSSLGGGVNESKVDEAISFLSDSLLVHMIPPLEMLLKKTHGPVKPCVCDHFVRNGILQETVPIDPAGLRASGSLLGGLAGHVVESILGYFLRGIPGLDLSWWPTRQDEPEIDFVVTIGTQRIPIEVKYQRQIEPADLAGIRTFCGKPHYSAPFGVLITQDTAGVLDPQVIAVPLSTFLLVR